MASCNGTGASTHKGSVRTTRITSVRALTDSPDLDVDLLDPAVDGALELHVLDSDFLFLVLADRLLVLEPGQLVRQIGDRHLQSGVLDLQGRGGIAGRGLLQLGQIDLLLGQRCLRGSDLGWCPRPGP